MILFRIGRPLLEQVQRDLSRPHPFAYERVGFLLCRSSIMAKHCIINIAFLYLPVPDEDYIEDRSVGARIGSNAIRKAMQKIIDFGAGAFHIHAHAGRGRPHPSTTDLRELPELVRSLANARPKAPHGFVILSDDQATGFCQMPSDQASHPIQKILVVGFPMQICV